MVEGLSYLVPGGTHFYPANSQIITSPGKPTELEAAIADFFTSKFGVGLGDAKALPRGVMVQPR